jgi:hypothetical protein
MHYKEDADSISKTINNYICFKEAILIHQQNLKGVLHCCMRMSKTWTILLLIS